MPFCRSTSTEEPASETGRKMLVWLEAWYSDRDRESAESRASLAMPSVHGHRIWRFCGASMNIVSMYTIHVAEGDTAKARDCALACLV